MKNKEDWIFFGICSVCTYLVILLEESRWSTTTTVENNKEKENYILKQLKSQEKNWTKNRTNRISAQTATTASAKV